MVPSIPPLLAEDNEKASLSTGLFDKGTLLAEQRFDIRTAFAEFRADGAGSTRIRRTRSRVRPISRPTSSSVAASYPVISKRKRASTFTLFGVQFEINHLMMPLFHIVILRGVFRPFSFFIGRCPATAFQITAQRGVYRRCNALVEMEDTADVINRFIQLLCTSSALASWSSLCDNSRGAQVLRSALNNVNRQQSYGFWFIIARSIVWRIHQS